MSYYSFSPRRGQFGAEKHEHGSFETFHVSNEEVESRIGGDPDAEHLPAGWYWWACFPGCLPDGDPSGPFETEAEAIRDADDR